MTNKIAGLAITVDGTTYNYEAHTVNRVVEILASQLDVLRTGTNENGFPEYSHQIEDFKINYFQN